MPKNSQLTVRQLTRRWPPGQYHIAAGKDVPRGLYMRQAQNGRYWFLRYEKPGPDGKTHEHWLGLGALKDVATAIDAAWATRDQLRAGADPIAARRAERATARAAQAATTSFRDCAASYFSEQGGKWKSAKHQRAFLQTLETFAFPVLGDLPVGAIDRAAVLRALQPFWKPGGPTAQAARVRGRIEKVIDWAVAQGLRPAGTNPAAWAGNLEFALTAPAHVNAPREFRWLPYEKATEFMSELRAQRTLAARALEFLMLTAVRNGEARGARWGEIDLDKRLWTIPPARMKMKVGHQIPLSSRALELLKTLPRDAVGDCVFPGGRSGAPIGPLAMMRVLRDDMKRADFDIHGFRKTFRTWAAENTAFAPDVIEMCLAHRVGSSVERAYNKGQLLVQRAALMEAWAGYCSAPAGSDEGNVVKLKAARR